MDIRQNKMRRRKFQNYVERLEKQRTREERKKEKTIKKQNVDMCIRRNQMRRSKFQNYMKNDEFLRVFRELKYPTAAKLPKFLSSSLIWKLQILRLSKRKYLKRMVQEIRRRIFDANEYPLKRARLVQKRKVFKAFIDQLLVVFCYRVYEVFDYYRIPRSARRFIAYLRKKQKQLN